VFDDRYVFDDEQFYPIWFGRLESLVPVFVSIFRTGTGIRLFSKLDLEMGCWFHLMCGAKTTTRDSLKINRWLITGFGLG
jgi:hypothetical protein